MMCSLEVTLSRFATMCSICTYLNRGFIPWADAGSGVHLVTALLAVIASCVVGLYGVWLFASYYLCPLRESSSSSLQAHHSGIFPNNITHNMLSYKRFVDRVLREIGLLSELFREYEQKERYRRRIERQREESIVGALFDSWSMPMYPP